MRFAVFPAIVTGALAAFTVSPNGAVTRPSRARTAVRMFEEPAETSSFQRSSPITRSQNVRDGREGSIVVTDCAGSFYESRTAFNMLYDFGRYASITASSTSTAEAKKMLISRKTRYSGLIDVLDFEETATGVPTFEGADSWLALNVADIASLLPQVDAAKAAGVSRAFILLSSSTPSIPYDELEAKLRASGLSYTVMRTGTLVESVAGDSEGLVLGEVDLPVCEDVAKEDVFRFMTEALTLPEAADRAFSLCPTAATVPALKQMRLCGYERRDEVQALLSGVVPEATATDDAAAAAPLSAAEEEQQAELVMRSEAEVAAEREAELKALIQKAKKRGEEMAKKMKYEEEEKLARRKEQEKYYSTPGGSDGDDDIPADTQIPDAPPPLSQ